MPQRIPFVYESALSRSVSRHGRGTDFAARRPLTPAAKSGYYPPRTLGPSKRGISPMGAVGKSSWPQAGHCHQRHVAHHHIALLAARLLAVVEDVRDALTVGHMTRSVG